MECTVRGKKLQSVYVFFSIAMETPVKRRQGQDMRKKEREIVLKVFNYITRKILNRVLDDVQASVQKQQECRCLLFIKYAAKLLEVLL